MWVDGLAKKSPETITKGGKKNRSFVSFFDGIRRKVLEAKISYMCVCVSATRNGINVKQLQIINRKKRFLDENLLIIIISTEREITVRKDDL